LEKLLSKRSLLLQKRDEFERKMREIGSLPTAEIDQYKNLGLKELTKQLHKTNQQLKTKSHVNKKAMDQYLHFSDQRDKLSARKEELDQSAKVFRFIISCNTHSILSQLQI
jgi:structural maintenance of chromosome 3 (chondroitin sulfate proteoglycan 6)